MNLKPTEKQIHAAVFDHWRTCGVPGSRIYTIPNMGALGQTGLTSGLPDIMMIGPGFQRISFMELKREGGKLSDAQEAEFDFLRSRGFTVGVAYGRDEPITIMEALGIVRRQAGAA